MINAVNSTSNNSPAFNGCALKGDGVRDFLNIRKAKEGLRAVKEFHEFLDNFTKWGYVNINKTPKADVFELQGKNGLKTKFHAKETLHDLKVRLGFLKENEAIIDQA